MGPVAFLVLYKTRVLLVFFVLKIMQVLCSWSDSNFSLCLYKAGVNLMRSVELQLGKTEITVRIIPFNSNSYGLQIC